MDNLRNVKMIDVNYILEISKHKVLKENEYKYYLKVLKECYDFKNKTPKIDLSTSEIEAIAVILYKLNYNEKEIKKFIKVSHKYYKKYDKSEFMDKNVLGYFIKKYEKMDYYSYDKALRDDLGLMKDYMSYMFICDDKEYKFWKDEIKIILLFTEGKLNKVQDYSYEMSKVKEIVKM